MPAVHSFERKKVGLKKYILHLFASIRTFEFVVCQIDNDKLFDQVFPMSNNDKNVFCSLEQEICA
jgi:hypothetical protein